jgi:hypothetical protein
MITYAVAAAVDSKLSSEDNSGDEGQKGGDRVHNDQNDWDRQTLHHGRNTAIDQYQPAENADEDRIVDTRWVSGESFSDDISNQRGCKKRPEELRSAKDNLYE